ncbi:MAG: ribulose-phosphate 3-epimerase [Deltaproteobacteria bacterium]|nr:ribulose-phosphate 3-epimerase [Deltaproteobacteria bacterium]
MKVRIAPSLLAADFSKLGDEVRTVEIGGADLLHVDVMDGHFVPPITVGANVVRDIRKVTRIPLDVHLMVERPDDLLDQFVDAGAACVTVHVEAARHLDRTVRYIKSRGIRAGVALNPATPLNSVYYVLGLVDIVLVMSVNPGWGGQPFLDYTLAKVEALKSEIRHRKLNTLIEVDGGVGLDNAAKLAKAGANILVAGTAVFGASDYAIAIRDLRAAGSSSASEP